MAITDRLEGLPKRRLSNLERVFGFESRPFGTYMNTQEISDKPPLNLIELSSKMAQIDHPLVLSAAGWAKAEAAMHKKKC